MKKAASLISISLLFIIFADVSHAKADNQYGTALKYYSQGNCKEAVKHLKGYVDKSPDPAAYYLIGYCFYKMGKFSQAEEYFDQAYLIDPTYSPGQRGTAEGVPKRKMKALKKTPSSEETTTAPVTGESKPAQAAVKSGVAPVKQAAQPQGKKTEVAPQKPQGKAVEPEKKTPVSAQVAQKTETPTPGAPKTGPQPQEKAVAPGVKAPTASSAAPPKTVPQQADLAKKPQMPGGMAGAALKSTLGAQKGPAAGFMVLILAISAVVYIYTALCLFLIAKKLDLSHRWTAWVPIAQLWTLVAAAGKQWWFVFLFLVPILNIVLTIYLWVCVTENLGKNKWLGLLMILPIVNLAFMGFLAFSKTERPAALTDTHSFDDFPEDTGNHEHMDQEV